MKKLEEEKEEEEEEEEEGISEFLQVQKERGRQDQENAFLTVRVRVTGPRPSGTRVAADQYKRGTWARVATEQYVLPTSRIGPVGSYFRSGFWRLWGVGMECSDGSGQGSLKS